MSETNLVLVKCFFEDRNQRDIQRYLGFFHRDAEIDSSELERPYAGIHRGHEQIESLFHVKNDPWQWVQYDTSGPLAVGDDRVIIDVRRTARVRPEGFGVWSAATAYITIQTGKIARYKLFPSRAQALRAAGVTAE